MNLHIKIITPCLVVSKEKKKPTKIKKQLHLKKLNELIILLFFIFFFLFQRK